MDDSILRKAAMLHPSEIPEPFDAIMEQFGFDAVCSIIDCFGGATIYIPSKRTVFKGCLEREAVREFKGSNYRMLTRKYGFSERHLRRMIAGK
jgi:Mor family transcriptional regulator